MAEITNKNWIGLFAVDAGMTTGLCYGAFPRKGATKRQVKRARSGGDVRWEQITGIGNFCDDVPEVGVAINVYDVWLQFKDKCEEAGIGTPRMIIEEFTLRGGARPLPTSDRHVLASARIGSILIGMLIRDADEGMEWSVLPKFYGPSESKSYATNDRLKRWGLWTIGQEHARDAARLIALHLARMREGKF